MLVFHTRGNIVCGFRSYGTESYIINALLFSWQLIFMFFTSGFKRLFLRNDCQVYRLSRISEYTLVHFTLQ